MKVSRLVLAFIFVVGYGAGSLAGLYSTKKIDKLIFKGGVYSGLIVYRRLPIEQRTNLDKTKLELLVEEAWREYTQTEPIGIGGFGSWNGNWLY